jgi:hypothetical protein
MGTQLAQVADVADVIALARFIPIFPTDFPPRTLFHLLECLEDGDAAFRPSPML